MKLIEGKHSRDVGRITMPDQSAILGIRLVDEDVVVYSATHIKVR